MYLEDHPRWKYTTRWTLICELSVCTPQLRSVASSWTGVVFPVTYPLTGAKGQQSWRLFSDLRNSRKSNSARKMKKRRSQNRVQLNNWARETETSDLLEMRGSGLYCKLILLREYLRSWWKQNLQIQHYSKKIFVSRMSYITKWQLFY